MRQFEPPSIGLAVCWHCVVLADLGNVMLSYRILEAAITKKQITEAVNIQFGKRVARARMKPLWDEMIRYS